jgi:hypothetical protein
MSAAGLAALTPIAALGGSIEFWGNGSEEDLDGVIAKHPWDVAYLANMALPGICEVKMVSVARVEIDKKKPKGVNYARVTILGYDPGTFDVSCKIWTRDHWTKLQQIVRTIWKGPTAERGDQASIAVRHPILRLAKVYSAIVVGFTPGVPGPEAGTMVFTFHLHENPRAQNKNVTASPAGSTTVVDPLSLSGGSSNGPAPMPSADKNFMSPVPK